MPAGSPVESKAAIPVDPRMPMQLRVTRVITAGQATSSQAFISINGEPARPFAVGALVRDGLYVRSVAANRVRITNDDTTIVFDLAVEGADQGAPAEDPAALQIKRQMGAAPGS
jgi:hypothetical protein